MARNLDEPGANFNQLLELSLKLQNARTFAGTKVADASTEMEQYPDTYLRPGETLEDWTGHYFRKPNAAGGRVGFNSGGSFQDILRRYWQGMGPWGKGSTGAFYVSDLYDALAPYLGMFNKGGRVYGKYAQQLASGGRVGYDKGDVVLPQAKPSEEEIKKIKWEQVLNLLKNVRGGIGHRGWLNMVSEHLDDGLREGIISKEQFNKAIMPLFGQAGEAQTRALEKDDSLPVKDLLEIQGEKREDYPAYLLAKGGRVGLAEGSGEPYMPPLNKYAFGLGFSEINDMENIEPGYLSENILKDIVESKGEGIENLLFKIYKNDPDKLLNFYFGMGPERAEMGIKKTFNGGGRVGLAEGDTPSQAWMRNYFFEAGYDDQGVITLDEYMNGPIGWKDYMEHGPGAS